MKIFLVGASGTLGQAVVAELKDRHTIVTGGRKGADVAIDITGAASIRAALTSVGQVDAIVCAAGSVKFAPLADFDEAAYRIGIDDKLMGQVNLVLIGRDHLADGGSFTLISGILSHDPIRFGSSASMVNGAIDSFVRAAAIELPRGIRINAVSPGVLEESMGGYGPFFRGHDPVPAVRVGRAYAKSVEGALTGRILPVL